MGYLRAPADRPWVGFCAAFLAGLVFCALSVVVLLAGQARQCHNLRAAHSTFQPGYCPPTEGHR